MTTIKLLNKRIRPKALQVQRIGQIPYNSS